VESGAVPADHDVPAAGFNGATAFQPWKVNSLFGLGAVRQGFNGATAFQPWKDT